ncbi:membrane protein insertase YidC [bacterium]|nr:membrane protein insertase YidC [bacterium]RQV93309.1 MAG: membrane protein insertase YidC [bacterium]
MDKNTIIALIIVGLILLLWPVYMRQIVGVNEAVEEQPAQLEMRESETLREPGSQAAMPSQRSVEEMGRSVIPQSSQSEKPDTLVVTTDYFRTELSSLGGGTIISWKLKQYRDKEGDWVELIPDSARGNLGLITDVDLSRVIFDIEVDTSGEVKTIRFVYSFEDEGRIEKVFVFRPDRYDVEMNVKFINFARSDIGGKYKVQWATGLNPTEENIGGDNNYYEAFALQGDEQLKMKEGDTGLREGATHWVAIRTKYFLMALIPREPVGTAAELQGKKIQFENNDWKTFTVQLTMPHTGMLEESAQFILYMGPMDYQQLKGYDVQLEKMMNFGWTIIRPFSIAFFYTLQFLYGIVHNYGWAIIIFSILVKIVLYPLTRKSYQSMRQMQALQPKMAALKEKYKKDPQKLNQETMKLYKQHGVNPMGGCLPMLLQMPVLFALFNLFRTTIMLREANFLGGVIKDLSAPDQMVGGINVLPIFMGATMIIQQKLSMQDPKQKAMAYMMPIFFCFIFYRMSAGLNLYYLMFNLLTIAQELLIKKKE